MNKRITALLSVLCVLSIVVVYRNSNMDKILASKAERAFRNNNIHKAQEYLEKSFELGGKNYKHRELYVNSIINSPFDEKAQEKLIKFLEYPIDDGAKLKAEYFLVDFRNQINKKYYGNYIKQAPYNHSIMRWSNIPITYDFTNTQDVPEYFIKEIENAITTWELATDHQILFLREPYNPNIIINFNANNPANNIEYGKYVVAYTTPDLSLNLLKNSTINFYLKGPSGEYYTSNQVYNTALHELTHALGVMGHSDNIDDIMYASKNSKTVLNDEREEPTESDINTLKLLYKIKPDITNSTEPKGEFTPYLVLGEKEQVQEAKMQEAISYVKKAPKLAGGYIDLAESFAETKDYENAEKSLKKALKLANTSEMKGMIYYNLGVIYFYQEDYSNSLKYLEVAGKIKDSNDRHYLLAEIYSKTGDLQKALKEHEFLVANNPQNIDYTIGLIDFYIKRTHYFKARKVLKNYINLNPKDRNNIKLKKYGIIKLGL